jgi:2-polyprenyl-6-methoxyphenol hydroxylase-like FAD-dependent oxidoreductase
MQSSTDVLVVGAGPVGLLLACELQRQGIDHLLIERQREPAYFCKALGVTPRTLEILGDFGVVEDAIDAGVWLTGVTIFDNGVERASQDLRTEEFPYGFLALPQYDTERILASCLRRSGGHAQRGSTLVSFVEKADGVEARIADAERGGATRTVSCRWLVGCDGAHSTVRKGLGLAFEGGKYPMTFMLGDVEVEWTLPRGRSYRFHRIEDGQLTNALVAVPIRGSPRRYRLSTAAPETIMVDSPAAEAAGIGEEATQAPTLDRLAEVALPMLPPGARLSALRWSSTYRISHRIVPRDKRIVYRT